MIKQQYPYSLLEYPARTVFMPVKGTKTTSIGILIGAGSITEGPDSIGYSHFLEHMVFKGTETYNVQKLNQEFEKMGAYLNAFTTKYHTMFYVHCMAEFAEKCLSLLLEIVFEAKLAQEDIEKEQYVISEEIASYKDIPEDFVLEQFYAQVFHDSFLGQSILGEESHILNISRNKLLEYYRSYYVVSNSLISIAGNFHQPQLEDSIQRYFETHSHKSSSPFELKKTVQFYKHQQNIVRQDLEQSYLCLGFHTSAWPLSRTALKVFNMLLGGMSSSRLFMNLREERALCYSVDSSIYSDPNMSFIHITGATQFHQSSIFLEAVQEVLFSFLKHPIQEEELLISKNQLKSGIVFRQESVSQLMLKNAAHMFFYDKIIPDSLLMKRLDAIQIQDFDKLYENLTPDMLSWCFLLSTEQKKR